MGSLTISMLAAGSHLTAVATANWFGTARYWTNRTLRQAIALSSIAVSALMCALPLRQAIQQGGWTSLTSPLLLPFTLLFVGWAAYAVIGRTRGDL